MLNTVAPRRRCAALLAAMGLIALPCSACSPVEERAAEVPQALVQPALAAANAPAAQLLPEAAPAPQRVSAEVVEVKEKSALARFIAAEYNTTKALAARIVNAAYAASARYQLSPSLVLAIISRESTFNPRATSGYGAQGLMQVVPRFHMDKLQEARAVTAEASLFHPETNIEVGSRILAEYIDTESNLPRALQKYSGRASRYMEKVMREHDAFERVRMAALEQRGLDA